MSVWPPANLGASNVFRQSYFPSFVDISGQTIMRNDVSMNTRLFVGAITALTYNGAKITTGGNNMGVGTDVLSNLTTGSNNTAIGNGALNALTTQSGLVAIGHSALNANTSGTANTAVGYFALYANSTGYNNTACGYGALDANTTGSSNNAFGLNALGNNTTGSINIAIGQSSLLSQTGGNNNVAIGNLSLSTLTDGTSNTYVGSNAGAITATGISSSTALGSNSGNHNFNGCTCIGFNSIATAANQIVLGTASETTISKGGIVIIDDTTKPATATSGSLTIKHNNSGGASSIVFPSAVNYNSDYGYIQYQDTSSLGGGGEVARLVIGTSNDGDDDIHLLPSGSVYTDKAYTQGQLGGGYTVSTVQGTNSRYVSRMSVNESGPYVEMAKYNSDRTTEAGRIGLSYFNSDCRLKEDINEPIIKNVSNYIKQIEFVSFKWKERKNPDDTCELGVIAQQLESIYPDLINTYTDSDTYGDGIGTKAVNTNTFSTFMMKGIQELIVENESLKSEIQKIKEYLNIV